MKFLLAALMFLAPAFSQANPVALDQIVGVGVQMDLENNNIVVKGIIPGSPAAIDGTIAVGDILKAVQSLPDAQWIDVAGIKIEELAPLIRGAENIKVGLRFARAATEYTVSITRGKFEAPKQ